MSSLATKPNHGRGPAPSDYDLFIIHEDADRAWVDGYLKHALGLDAARVMTPHDFRLGATTTDEFERGVTSSRFTLLVLSPAFLAGRWTEFGAALVSFSSVEEGKDRLLAVTLHACPVPLHIRFRESLDCTDWTRWDDEAARLRRHLGGLAPLLEAIPCPYPGKAPFRGEDARFFHGRDAEIQNLLTLAGRHQFLAVVGSSGSGKSSLITAGLLPKLDDPRSSLGAIWRVLTMRPGAAPSEELARVLDGATQDPAGSISRALAAEPSAQRLLLLVDQFDELFSQVKRVPRRNAFIGHLNALRADPRCTLILTMRAEFRGKLMKSALRPMDKSQLVEVAALRGEELRQAIVKPAEAVGVCLEERLIDRLLADAADEPGSLPTFQEALVMLWGRMSGRLLTEASYDALRSKNDIPTTPSAKDPISVADPVTNDGSPGGEDDRGEDTKLDSYFRVDVTWLDHQSEGNVAVDVGFLRVRLRGTPNPLKPILCGCGGACVMVNFQSAESVKDPIFWVIPDDTETWVEFGISDSPLVWFESKMSRRIIKGRGRIHYWIRSNNCHGCLSEEPKRPVRGFVRIKNHWFAIEEPGSSAPHPHRGPTGTTRVVIDSTLHRLQKDCFSRPFLV
jgi:hypothetical protein